MSDSELNRFTDFCRYGVNVTVRISKVPNDRAFIVGLCKYLEEWLMPVLELLVTLATWRRFHPKSPKAGNNMVRSYTDGHRRRSLRLTISRAASNFMCSQCPKHQ